MPGAACEGEPFFNDKSGMMLLITQRSVLKRMVRTVDDRSFYCPLITSWRQRVSFLSYIWALQNVSWLGTLAERVVLVGDSAGGLALSTALKAA